jgi:hypothetical protein
MDCVPFLRVCSDLFCFRLTELAREHGQNGKEFFPGRVSFALFFFFQVSSVLLVFDGKPGLVIKSCN